jgi:hypothetical protein
MTLVGPRAAIDIALPTGIDTTEVLNFQLRDGVSGEQIVAEAAAVIGEVNQRLINRYGGLLATTQTLYSIGTQGETSRSMTKEVSEFKRPDGKRAQEIGQMLPIRDYADATEWTPMWLRDCRRDQALRDVAKIAQDWEDRVDYDILTRALTNSENAISSSGYDVPWAIGTGMNVNYIPPQYRGYIFSASHSHFKYYNGTVTAQCVNAIKNAVKELRHHGHTGRLVALVSDTDVDTWAGKTDNGFVELNPTGFQVVAGSSSAPVRVTTGEVEGMPGELFGYFKTNRGVVEMRYHERIPTGYLFVTKSYGVNNPNNGLAVRTHPNYGFGMRVRPQVTSDINPELDFIKFEATHGVGVNDRTNGHCTYMASGASEYTNPSFS